MSTTDPLADEIETRLRTFFADRFVYVVDPSGARLGPDYLAEVATPHVTAVVLAAVAADPTIVDLERADCERCNGHGVVAPGSECPECGGSGVVADADGEPYPLWGPLYRTTDTLSATDEGATP
jgi:hypothetical protein